MKTKQKTIRVNAYGNTPEEHADLLRQCGLPDGIAKPRSEADLDRLYPYTKTRRTTMIDTTLVKDVEVEGIDMSDYPDFCDAFISSATYDGREMTEGELDELNDDGGFVYEKVMEYLY